MRHCKKNIAKIMFTEKQIQKKIIKLGKQITKDYKGKDLVVVCVLRGSALFVCDLIRHIDLPLELDFIWVKSYEETQSTGSVKLLKKPAGNLKNRDVLLVDDILDTGITFEKTIQEIKKSNPKSLKIAAFLDKPSRRKIDVRLDYVGITIENEFIVGYGMDYNQKFRNLPFIGVFKK
ncbi:MAG TPA: hypoxanthine phosphoribosyltransferase [bacterium]|nr:hypoxanthine phosphoribosyltransferase [bacterium]